MMMMMIRQLFLMAAQLSPAQPGSDRIGSEAVFSSLFCFVLFSLVGGIGMFYYKQRHKQAMIEFGI